MLICLHIAYGCFHTIATELSTCDRDCTAWKAENIYTLALYRKSWQGCPKQAVSLEIGKPTLFLHPAIEWTKV